MCVCAVDTVCTYLVYTYIRTYVFIHMYLHVCIVELCAYCICMSTYHMYVPMYVRTYIQYNSLYPSLHTVCSSSTLNLFLFALSPLPSPPGFNDMELLREMFASSRTARCRSRFVVPVILLNDHTHICRSATLSTYAELCGRQGYDWLSSELISSMFIFCPANHSM